MRYQYTFNVISRINIGPQISFVHGGFTFRVISRNNRFTALVVETPSVELPQNWKPEGSSAGIPTLTSPPEPYFITIQEEVRAIRGALTLWGMIDIDVDQPNREFIPETPTDHQQLDLFGINLKRRPRTDLPIGPSIPDIPIRCILARAHFSDYEVPFEFYRRGSDDCYHSHFVEAVFNFFFVLEYLFREGKFKTNQLEASFSASSELQSAVCEAQRQLSAPSLNSAHWTAPAIAKYGKRSFDEIVKTIVELRGFLHHQSLKRRKNWNPGFRTNSNQTRTS